MIGLGRKAATSPLSGAISLFSFYVRLESLRGEKLRLGP